MQNGLYVAISAQVALERRLETIADNIANMNTVGFCATGVSFEAEIARAGETTLNYVSPGFEMTRLIEVTRAFDGVATEVSQSEGSLQDAIKTLGSAS